MFHVLVFTLSLVLGVHTFMFDDPCYVSPPLGWNPDGPDSTLTVVVPPFCNNGTFRWDTPRGHVMLNFRNTRHVPTSICIKDKLGGDVFTITDVTSAPTLTALEKFTYDEAACTKTTTAGTITLRIDAPEEFRYVAGIAYTVIQH